MASFTLSDTVIIIICAGGVVLIIAVVLLLILCITSKTKDNVRPIRATPRRHPQVHVPARPRRPIMPKPPPYSEFPPDYNDWSNLDVTDLDSSNQNPSSSRGIRRTGSIRTRNGSPHPTTSARRMPSTERTDFRIPASNINARANNFQNEALVNLDTQRDVLTHHRGVRGAQDRERQIDGRPVYNQARVPANIMDPSSASPNTAQTGNITTREIDLLPGEIGYRESPRPSNPSAAARHEQRRQALNTLRVHRQHMMTPSPPPDYER